MKKKQFIIIILFIIVLLIYFGYKGYLFYYYKAYTHNQLKEAIDESKETITLEKNTNLVETTNFENIIYPKLKDNFVLKEDETMAEGYNYAPYYWYKDNKEKPEAAFKVGEYNYTMYDIISKEDLDINTFGFSFKNTNDKKLLKKYNITDETSLYKYILKHYKDNVNIFSSRDDMRINYLIKTFAEVALPYSKIYMIDGNYKGYMYVIGDLIYEVHLIKDNKNYVISFWNGQDKDYFNLDYIKEFLNHITIE